jgi:TRAP-type C4-dicarboxylate transport system permease small subunit
MTITIEKKIFTALLRFLDKGLKTLTGFSLVLGAMLVGLLMLSYVFEVIARYFFDSPTSWVFDLGRGLLCVSLILALPDVTQSQGHISIDFILEKMSPQKKVERVSLFHSYVLLFAW